MEKPYKVTICPPGYARGVSPSGVTKAVREGKSPPSDSHGGRAPYVAFRPASGDKV